MRRTAGRGQTGGRRRSTTGSTTAARAATHSGGGHRVQGGGNVHPAQLLGATGDTGLVVDLQRLAGNGATTALLERPASPSPPPRRPASPGWSAPGARPHVQRLLPSLGDLVSGTLERAADVGRRLQALATLERLVGEGQRDEIVLTDELWKIIHPELSGVRLDPKKPDHAKLIAEWRSLRTDVVRPRVRKAQQEPKPTTTPTADKPVSTTTPTGPRPKLGTTPAIATADPARTARLAELASAYEANVASGTALADQLKGMAADDPARGALDGSLQALLGTRLGLLQTRLGLLDEEIAWQSSQVSSAPKKEKSKLQKAVTALTAERKKTFELLGPILRMTLRQRAARLDQQIAELDALLADNPQDADAARRKAALESERADLGGQMTATAKEFHQGKGPWANKQYVREGSTIKSSGCGPTSLAMILNYLEQEDPDVLARGNYLEIVTPDVTADYAAKVKARTTTTFGTKGGTMVSKVSTEWPGYKGQEVELDAAVAALRRGSLVLFNAKEWEYSTDQSKGKTIKSKSKGHFMVLAGVSPDGQTFDVLDPGNSRISGVKITLAELKRQAKAGKKTWVIERK
jgi:hypothetical protein